MAMPTTICIINQKGGSGKTSTCFHLAGALAQGGLQVLLVDADPQGSLSKGFLGATTVESLGPRETLTALFDEQAFFSAPRPFRPTAFERITLCPTNHHLDRMNKPCPEDTGMDQFVLREFLDRQDAFDIVLVDCPPNLYGCTWTAMVAADYVMIPVPPEDFGTQGLRAVHQAVENARPLNPDLLLLGHLVTRYDGRLLVHRSYQSRLRQHYGEMVLDTVIPEASAFKLSVSARKPVEMHRSRSQAASLTRQLSREILDRIAVKNAKRQAG
jgi:chromosome partitioning protein